MDEMVSRLLLPANESFAGAMDRLAMDAMQAEVTCCIADLLAALRIEPDHNTDNTPGRVARMLVGEVFAGRYAAAPDMTTFPNDRGVDQIDVVGPISYRSCCAHHLVPIMGEAWIGTIATEKLLGLSKYHRLTEWVMARPQIQEEAAHQLANALAEVTEPRALGVVLRARHFCCAWRGVRDAHSLLVTSVMRGLFKDDPRARGELMSLMQGMGFG